MSAVGERLTFKARVRVALADPLLKVAIDRTTGNARASVPSPSTGQVSSSPSMNSSHSTSASYFAARATAPCICE